MEKEAFHMQENTELRNVYAVLGGWIEERNAAPNGYFAGMISNKTGLPAQEITKIFQKSIEIFKEVRTCG